MSQSLCYLWIGNRSKKHTQLLPSICSKFYLTGKFWIVVLKNNSCNPQFVFLPVLYCILSKVPYQTAFMRPSSVSSPGTRRFRELFDETCRVYLLFINLFSFHYPLSDLDLNWTSLLALVWIAYWLLFWTNASDALTVNATMLMYWNDSMCVSVNHHKEIVAGMSSVLTIKSTDLFLR